MKENIDLGQMINGNQEPSNNGVIEKWCYDNDSEQCNEHGGLYSWDEAMQYNTTPGAQGICPSGWHIPTAEQFGYLEREVNWDGNSLKAIGEGKAGGAGTNSRGFFAFLAGFRGIDGKFIEIGQVAAFWTSYYYNDIRQVMETLTQLEKSMGSGRYDRNFGVNIRCVKD